MSYGLTFVPPEERLEPSLQRLYETVAERQIRSRIIPPNVELQRSTRNIARLFNTGCDDPSVLKRVTLGHRIKDDSHTISTTRSMAEAQKERRVPPHLTATLPLSQVIHEAKLGNINANNSLSLTEPHVSPLQGSPSLSTSNLNTPKFWDFNATRKTAESSHCSKAKAISSSVSNDPSQLQATLVACGRLSLVEAVHDQKHSEQVAKTLKRQKKGLIQHAKWMQRGIDRESWHLSEAVPPENPSIASSNQSIRTASTLSASTANSWVPFTNSKQSSSVKDDNVNILNPFRRDHDTRSLVRQNRRLPRPVNPLDCMEYKDGAYVRRVRNFNAVIQPSILIGETPSQEEISEALGTLTRKQILCYNFRVVEIGSLIHHLKNSRHETPGLQAVFALHEACISAAAMSTNPFILSRNQLRGVLTKQVPWIDGSSVERLLMAFDNTNTGYVRYVRLSATCLACMEPAMASLAVSLDISSVQIVNQFESFNRSNKNELNMQEYLKDVKAELLVIRFLHQLYCDVVGGGNEKRVSFSNLTELMSCCARCPEDEKRISALLMPFVEERLKMDALPIDAEQLLRHDRLQSLVGHQGVTIEELTGGLLHHRALLQEFIDQVKGFRLAARPFILRPSHSVDDALTMISSSKKSHRMVS